jgi:hypothetical protein
MAYLLSFIKILEKCENRTQCECLSLTWFLLPVVVLSSRLAAVVEERKKGKKWRP